MEELLSSLPSKLEEGRKVAQNADTRHNCEEETFRPILVLLHIELTFAEALIGLHRFRVDEIESTVLPIEEKHQVLATVASGISIEKKHRLHVTLLGSCITGVTLLMS